MPSSVIDSPERNFTAPKSVLFLFFTKRLKGKIGGKKVDVVKQMSDNVQVSGVLWKEYFAITEN